MSSPAHRLTGAGKLVINSLVALVIYLVFSQLLPAFDHQWLVALLILAGVSSLLGHTNFSLPTAPARQSAGRVEGSIKWFNGTKGYGFITGDDGTEVFVHFKSVEEVDKRRIKPGQRFSYTVAESDRGPQAEDVKPL